MKMMKTGFRSSHSLCSVIAFCLAYVVSLLLFLNIYVVDLLEVTLLNNTSGNINLKNCYPN